MVTRLRHHLHFINRSMQFIEKLLLVVCACLFMLLMFLGAGDVIGRYFFSRPITGAYEISSILMGAIVFLGWAHTQRQGGHVAVDLFYRKFPPRAQRVAAVFSDLLVFLLFAFITYRSWELAVSHTAAGRTFQTIDLVSGPFHFLVPVGAALMCVEILLGLVSTGRTTEK